MRSSQEENRALRQEKFSISDELSKSQAIEAHDIVANIGPENNYEQVVLDQEDFNVIEQGDKSGLYHSQENSNQSSNHNRSEFESLSNKIAVRKHVQPLSQVEKNFFSSGTMNLCSFSFNSGSHHVQGHRQSGDPRKGDAAFICFKIQVLEFFCPTIKFTSKSPYFERCILNQLEEHEKLEQREGRSLTRPQLTIVLSEETRPSMLLLVLDYLKTGWSEFNQLNLYTAKNIVQISECLKLKELQKKTLLSVIVQQLNRENVLKFISMSFERISEYRQKYRLVTQHRSSSLDSQEDMPDEDESIKSDNKVVQKEEVEEPVDPLETMSQLKEEEEYWLDFFYYCLDLAAANILFIIESKENEMIETLPESVIFEIISKAINFYRSDPNYENRPLIHLLMKINDCSSAFHLLAKERQRIVQNEMEVRKINERQPLLTWSVNQLSKCFYKQSDTFSIEGAQWRLAVSFFKEEDPTLKVQLKLINNPFDIKKNKEYFKKKEFEVPSNLDDQKIDPVGQFEVEKEAEEQQEDRVNELNQTALDFPNHTFVTFLASIKLDFDQQLCAPKVHSMICSAKAPTQLETVQGFELESLPDPSQLNVGFYMQMSHLHAQILHYISKNFTYLINDPDIKYLTKEEFKLLLKHKYLYVVQEDEVIKAICLWIEGQPGFQSKRDVINRPDLDSNMRKDADQVDLQESLREILTNVNWDYVSLACILDLIRNKPMLRQCPEFQKAIIAQFQVRQNAEDPKAVKAADKLIPPIFKENPRYSYKYNQSQRSRYKKVAEDSNENRAFQSLHPVKQQDFIVHLTQQLMNPVNVLELGDHKKDKYEKVAHKRHLEQQMMLKLQEAKFLQNQIRAIEMLEGIHVEERKDITIQSAHDDSLHMASDNTSNCDIEDEDLDEFADNKDLSKKPFNAVVLGNELYDFNVNADKLQILESDLRNCVSLNSQKRPESSSSKSSHKSFIEMQAQWEPISTAESGVNHVPDMDEKISQTEPDKSYVKLGTQVRVVSMEIKYQKVVEEDFYDCVESAPDSTTIHVANWTNTEPIKMVGADTQTKMTCEDITSLTEKIRFAKLKLRQFKADKDEQGTQTEIKESADASTQSRKKNAVDNVQASTIGTVLSSPLQVIEEKTTYSKKGINKMANLKEMKAFSQDILETNFLSPRGSVKENLSSFRAPFSTLGSPLLDDSRKLLQDFLVSDRSCMKSSIEEKKTSKSRKGKKMTSFTPMLSKFLKGNKIEKEKTLSKKKHHQRSKTTLEEVRVVPPQQDMSLYKRSRSRSDHSRISHRRAPSQSLTVHDEKVRALQFAKGITSNRQKMAQFNILEQIQSPRHSDQDDVFIGRHFSR